MTILWSAMAIVLALVSLVVVVLLGRPMFLLAEIWWIMFLAFMAGMVAAWYGQSGRRDRAGTRRARTRRNGA